jgi:AcrR family transcriptional regulator
MAPVDLTVLRLSYANLNVVNMRKVPKGSKEPKAPKGSIGSKAAKRPKASNGRPYHHGALQEALVDTAAQLAAERGAAMVSLREVARRAGVSQAAPYHYFADKSALLAAVAEAGFRLFDTTQAEALVSAPADPAARLAALGVAYVRFALDHPHYFKVMFRPHLVEHRKYPSLAAVSGRSFERLVETVRAARLAAGNDDADPLAAATLVWSVPHGLATLYLDGPISDGTTPRALEALVRAATPALAAASLEGLVDGEPHWGV